MAYRYDQSGSQASRVQRGKGGTGTSGSNTSEVGGSNQGAITDLGLSESTQSPQTNINIDTGSLAKDIRKRLSTSWRDFSVSTDDAVWVFQALEGLSVPALEGVLAQVDDNHIERFFDKLPEHKKITRSFGKIATALGPTRIKPYVSDLMSRSMFDWVVSDKDAERATRLILALPSAYLIEILDSMGPEQVDTLVSNLNSSVLLGKLFSVRFNIDVGATETDGDDVGIDWSVKGLRQMWAVFEALPAAHVAENSYLDEITRFRDTTSDNAGSGGWYSSSEDEIAIQYMDEGLHYTNTGGMITEKETLFAGNYFDQTIRHEVGHAVDDKIDGYSKLCKTSAGGKWKWESDMLRVIRTIVKAHGESMASLDSGQKKQLFDVIAGEMPAGDWDGLTIAIQESDVGRSMDGSTLEAILSDPALGIIEDGMSEPWTWDSMGGTEVNGRIYQRSYDNFWTSYEAKARQKSVSAYQFRAPGEWFAEAYAAYYDPRYAKGSGLGRRDPKAKRWFDQNIESNASNDMNGPKK